VLCLDTASVLEPQRIEQTDPLCNSCPSLHSPNFPLHWSVQCTPMSRNTQPFLSSHLALHSSQPNPILFLSYAPSYGGSASRNGARDTMERGRSNRSRKGARRRACRSLELQHWRDLRDTSEDWHWCSRFSMSDSRHQNDGAWSSPFVRR